MKLNRDIKYVTPYTDTSGVCMHLVCKLPTQDCVRFPSMVVMEYEGVYYVLKSRWEVEGDPYNSSHKAYNPYDLDFVVYQLEDLRAVCNPASNYRLPDGFIGKNVLIRV